MEPGAIPSSTRRGRLLLGALWGLLALLLSVAGWQSLKACGVRWPGGAVSWCRIPDQGAALASLEQQRQRLLADLAALEHQAEALPECSPGCFSAADERPLDVFWLQDVSSSFSDDLPNLKAAMQDLAKRRAEGLLPAGFRLGVGSFSDKPLPPHGVAPVDFTFRLDLPLTQDVAKAVHVVETLRVANGGDTPEEAQWEAVIEALGRQEELGFTPGSRRFLVVVTDAPASEAGAWRGAPRPEDGNADSDPLNEDYPSRQQVKDKIVEADITPVFLVANTISQNYYRKMVRFLGRGTVVPISSTSEGLLSALLAGLATVCHEASP
ncbi:vWA domain-containing protein [Pararhodospirillum oryzae]|uniref:VWFA domain-containing protein n=1 Tax=Pararhodospirillum oryzae TaxID=478448 RepID=A0A512H8H9_9PROT|nr:hypothetical protein [Pararhodospirillum oryzae]GEO81728.1 hypothetical protein ROR02_18590 [Pararhodospirillum oryzae]